MPASYVHQCVAREALAPALVDGASLNAALAGAEGPDPLLYSVFPNPGGPYPPRVGSLLHTKRTDDFLLALLDACARDETLRAFALGFLTHYATDTTFHPFVCAHSLTPQGAYSGNAHCRLEHGLETLHYRRTGHPDGLPVQFAGYEALSRAQKEAIARALAESIAAVYPERALSPARVLASFDHALLLCRLLRSEGGSKYRACGALPFGLNAYALAHMMPLQPPREDIANDAHARWASLWEPDRERTESFGDLFASAVRRSGELAGAARDMWAGRVSHAAFRELTGGLSYGSGVPWRESCPPSQSPGALRAAQQKNGRNRI